MYNFKPMSLTGMKCDVKLRCANNYIGGCTAGMMHCDNFDPEVHVQIEIEHNNQSARFTCTNNSCGKVSPATSAPETTTTTVVTSTLQCESTHTTHSCETTSIVCNSSSTDLLVTIINPLYTTSSTPISSRHS